MFFPQLDWTILSDGPYIKPILIYYPLISNLGKQALLSTQLHFQCVRFIRRRPTALFILITVSSLAWIGHKFIN